jgi:hypothetical protein
VLAVVEVTELVARVHIVMGWKNVVIVLIFQKQPHQLCVILGMFNAENVVHVTVKCETQIILLVE